MHDIHHDSSDDPTTTPRGGSPGRDAAPADNAVAGIAVAAIAVGAAGPADTEAVELARDPADVPAVFAAAFNTGDPHLVDLVYEPEAIFVPPDAAPVSGAQRRRANSEFLALGLPITVMPRRTYVCGDIALLLVDWTIDGPGPDGEHIHVEGAATDVARRGTDGRWRYVIDSPFGIASPPPVPDLRGAGSCPPAGDRTA